MMEKLLKIGALFDLYGALLTEKQRRCLEMHFLDDLSLSEIADECGVSRQAIYDIIRRSEIVLDDYEEKLHLAARYREERREMEEIRALLGRLPTKVRDLEEIKHARRKLSHLIHRTEEA